ncbi:MAG: hypothetical protein IJ062_13370, partial [Firmicutes bacterium]|nr:hypothetical protein [Bacillota bacterium]
RPFREAGARSATEGWKSPAGSTLSTPRAAPLSLKGQLFILRTRLHYLPVKFQFDKNDQILSYLTFSVVYVIIQKTVFLT